MLTRMSAVFLLGLLVVSLVGCSGGSGDIAEINTLLDQAEEVFLAQDASLHPVFTNPVDCDPVYGQWTPQQVVGSCTHTGTVNKFAFISRRIDLGARTVTVDVDYDLGGWVWVCWMISPSAWPRPPKAGGFPEPMIWLTVLNSCRVT